MDILAKFTTLPRIWQQMITLVLAAVPGPRSLLTELLVWWKEKRAGVKAARRERGEIKGDLKHTLHLSGWEKWDHYQKKIDELLDLARTQRRSHERRVMHFRGFLLLGETPDPAITLETFDVNTHMESKQ